MYSGLIHKFSRMALTFKDTNTHTHIKYSSSLILANKYRDKYHIYIVHYNY